MYVSKAKIFILLTLANYGPIYLIDVTNTSNSRLGMPKYKKLRNGPIELRTKTLDLDKDHKGD